MTDAKGATAPGFPSDTTNKRGLLVQVDALLAMAKTAQEHGDTLASLDLAMKAQEFLHLHKLLREPGDG